MAVTSGFYNSKNGDRKYNAEQMSAIFNGIINDGVLANIGTAFKVTATTGNVVQVGIGRAWFNSTWIYNDAILPVTLDASSVLLNRIDAVIIEVDRSDNVRAASIKVKKGTEASSPTNPTMTNTELVHQYPLAYIYRGANTSSITQGNITNAVGTSSCPYVTGILQVQSIDNIVAQWQAQWIEWYANETATTEAQADAIIALWNQWYTNETATSEGQIDDIIEDWNQWYSEETTALETTTTSWLAQMKNDIIGWFNALQILLDDETAVELGNAVVALTNKFEELAKDRCVYMSLEDSNESGLLDSNGNPIEGRTTFPINQSTGGMEMNGLVTYPTFEEHVKQFEEYVSETESFKEQTNNDITGLKYDSEVFYNDIENNSYKIGDLKTTTRSNLGDKWLLCNGDGISASDYPDLASLLGDISKTDQWRSSTVSSNLGSQVRYANGYYLSSNRFTTDIINGPITSFTVQTSGYSRTCGTTVYSNGIYYTSVNSGGYWGPSFGIVQNSTLSASTVQYIELDDAGQPNSRIKVLDFVKINSYYLMLVLFVVDSTNTSDNYDHTDFTLYLYRATSDPTVPNNWSRTTVWTDEYDFGHYYTSYVDTNIFYGKIKYVNGRYIICGSMFKNIPFIAYSASPSYFTIVKLEDDEYYDSEYFKAGATDVNYVAGRYVVSYNIGSSSSTTKFAISSTSTLSSSTTWTKISTSVPGPIGDFYYLDGCYYVPDRKGSLWTGAQPNSLSKFVSPFGTLSLNGRPSVLNVGSDIVMVYPLSGSYKTIYYKASDVTLPSISLSDSAYTYIKALE